MIRLFFFALTRALRLVLEVVSNQFAADRGSLRNVISTLLFLGAFLLLQSLHWFCFFLDELFFRGYRKIIIKKPVILVGIPRSGTTFLHRLLAADSQFTTMRTWECILAPSIIERKLLLAFKTLYRRGGRPLNRKLTWLKERLRGQFDTIHTIRLNAPEEDYLTLLPIISCFLLVLPFPGVEFLWRLSRFDHELSKKERTFILRFYRKMQQKHLYVHGVDKTMLSKNAAFPSLVGSLISAFPDGRIIWPIRRVDKAFLSQLSSIRSGILFFGHRSRATRFRDQFCELFAYYSSYLQGCLSGLPQGQYITVHLEEIRTGLSPVIHRLYHHFNLTMDQDIQQHIAREDLRSKSYRSSHVYDLDIFQLEKIQLYKCVMTVDGYAIPVPATGESFAKKLVSGKTSVRVPSQQSSPVRSTA